MSENVMVPVAIALDALNRMQSLLMMDDGRHPRNVLRDFINAAAPTPERRSGQRRGSDNLKSTNLRRISYPLDRRTAASTSEWIKAGNRFPDSYPFVVRWNDETTRNVCDRYEVINAPDSHDPTPTMENCIDWGCATDWLQLREPKQAAPNAAGPQLAPNAPASTTPSVSESEPVVPAAPEPYWKTMCGEESNSQVGLKMPGVGGIACGLNEGHSGRHSWEYSFEELQGTTAAPGPYALARARQDTGDTFQEDYHPAAPEPYWKTMCGAVSNSEAERSVLSIGGITCGLNEGHSGRHSWEYPFDEPTDHLAAPDSHVRAAQARQARGEGIPGDAILAHQEPAASNPLKVWSCKIGECNFDHHGADMPMREAVASAYKAVTGRSCDFIFSGWGAELTEPERAVVENRLPAPPTPASTLPPEPTRLALDTEHNFMCSASNGRFVLYADFNTWRVRAIELDRESFHIQQALNACCDRREKLERENAELRRGNCPDTNIDGMVFCGKCERER